MNEKLNKKHISPKFPKPGTQRGAVKGPVTN